MALMKAAALVFMSMVLLLLTVSSCGSGMRSTPVMPSYENTIAITNPIMEPSETPASGQSEETAAEPINRTNTEPAVSSATVPDEAPITEPDESTAAKGEGTILEDASSVHLFEGVWERTEVLRQSAAHIRITNQTKDSFIFTLMAFWGDHVGELSGKANIKEHGTAVFIIEATDCCGGGTLVMLYDEHDSPHLDISYHGDHDALDFGRYCEPGGTYVLGKPEYTSDGYPMLVFENDEVFMKIKTLMGESAYANLLYVMREGFPSVVGRHRYRGFIAGEGNMGADLAISDTGQIYLMAYSLSDRKYVFYTSDVMYHGWLNYPEFLDIDESVNTEEVNFEYNGNLDADANPAD
jgi:hypothetical protein